MTNKLKDYAEKLYPKKGIPLADVGIMLEGRIAFNIGFQLGAEFAEWASAEGWRFIPTQNEWKMAFNVNGKKRYATTPELTELFLNDKMKEK